MLKIIPGTRLILASSSPRRKELLLRCGIAAEVMPAEISEEQRKGERPEAMVTRLAREKAEEVAKRHPGATVIGADTTVEIGGEVLGKPSSSEEAKRMLSKIQGRTHNVYSAFAIVKHPEGELHAECSRTSVEIAPLSAAAIDAYVATKEPLDKAGAYGAQERGAFFISRIDGSYSNVVGMNLAALVQSLLRLGVVSFHS